MSIIENDGLDERTLDWGHFRNQHLVSKALTDYYESRCFDMMDACCFVRTMTEDALLAVVEDTADDVAKHAEAVLGGLPDSDELARDFHYMAQNEFVRRFN